MCELQTGGNLLSLSCQHVRGAELLAQGVSSLTQPFSSLSALFWKWPNTLALYNLSTLYHFSTSHPRLWAQKQGISVSPSPPLFQDLPHPFPLIQPTARIAVWSELCAPCQKFLPKMKKKKTNNQTTMFDKSDLFKTLRSLTEIFPLFLPAHFWKPLPLLPVGLCLWP